MNNLFEGRTYADNLAKRGYVVLCLDVMYLVSQKLYLNKMPFLTNETVPDLQTAA